MLGLGPRVPGAPFYVLGSPAFTKATIGGLTIEAPGASLLTKYVTAAKLDGKPLDRAWLLPGKHAKLSLAMAPQPDKAFGAAASRRPPSASTAKLSVFGC